MEQVDYYEVLGVRPDAEFEALRRAYRARAMQCHPDRFGGQSSKAEEFKIVGEAFNVLSDPLSRRSYDLSRGVELEFKSPPSQAFDMGVYPEDEGAILDTLADDILEELIVGNTLPRGTTLQTLLLDLEQTEQFCLFREAKTKLYAGSTVVAAHLFRRYLQQAPGNILARYFLSKCCVAGQDWEGAERQLRLAIRIGDTRQPPLKLLRLRQELERVRTCRPGLLAAVRRLFAPTRQPDDGLTADERERRSLNREINRLAAERLRRPPSARGHLPPAGSG